jgi:serine phosphatase RsbU (regulator of sigma subunit)
VNAPTPSAPKFRVLTPTTRLRDLPLAVKQGLGFGLVIVAMGAVSLWLFVQLASLRQGMDELGGHRLPGVLATLELAHLFADLHTAQLPGASAAEAASGAGPDPAVEALVQSVDAALAHYRDVGLTETIAGPQAGAYQALVAAWAPYRRLSLAHAAAGPGLVPPVRVGPPGRRLYDECRHHLARLAEAEARGAATATARAEAAYRATRRLLLLALLVAAAGSAAISAVLVGAVSRPLAALARGATAVAHGNLDVHLDSGSRDEMGRLATAFNEMTAALRQSQTQARAQTEAITRAHQELQEQSRQNQALSAQHLSQERQLRREAERELEAARRLQVSLMPDAGPAVEGYDIAGKCVPASHVGGDFFQYFPLSGRRLALGLADVTGHGMEAAIPVVLFSGMLESEVSRSADLGALLGQLNRTLYRVLDRRAFVCFAMGELLLDERVMNVTNSGCPYPLHYCAAQGAIREVQLDAYPLGIRAEALYRVQRLELQPADRVVLLSDGIVEALNEQGEMLGYERALAAINQACCQARTSQGVIDRVLARVQAHMGGAPPSDDQTILVVGVG